MSRTIVPMPPSHHTLIAEIDAAHEARTEALRALRAAQDEYLTAERLRKQATRAALTDDNGHTQMQIADALGLRTRTGLLHLAAESRGRSRLVESASDYRFSRPVLVELRELAERFDAALTARRELVRALRAAPKAERLTFEEMGAAMGLSAEGVRYLTRGSGRR